MSGGVIVEAARRLGNVVIGLVGVDTLFDVDKERSPEEVAAFMGPFRTDFAKAARRIRPRRCSLRRSMQNTPRRSFPPSSLPLP